MLSAMLLENEDDYYMAQEQDRLERNALRLAAAWADFDMVEESATEVVRRFGGIVTADHGLLRLHKQPLFTALQTACVIGYARPYSERNGLDPKYGTYSNSEWQDLHETLFVWKERLSGNLGASFRAFVVASEDESGHARKNSIVGETTSVLDPSRHFSVLREMCADRKVMIWEELQAAISQRYPILYRPIVLGQKKLMTS